MRLRAKLTLRNEAMLAARKRFGLSQKSLAELAECPIGAVGELEALNYTRWNVRQIADRVAGALELEPAQVMPAGVEGEQFDSTVSRVADVALDRLTQVQQNALPSPVMEADETALHDELAERIGKVLATLSYREREIVKLRYGLGDDGQAHTLAEVGRIFQVGKERVRQIEAKAIRKLQQPARSKELVAFK